MRICQIVSHVDEEASGPSYSVPRLAEALAGHGHDVVLATLASRGGRQRTFTAIQHVEFANTSWPVRLGRSRPMRQWLSENAAKFDIIHSHGLWMMPNIYPAWAAHAAQVPHVVSPRGTLSEAALKYSAAVKSVFWFVVQRSALAGATVFHATSTEELADVRRIGFSQPVAVIANGIDMSDAAARPGVRAARGEQNARTLLYLGRIHPKKGLDMALPAWRSLQHEHPDWQFRIIGRGDAAYIDALRAMARELGAERVQFEEAAYGEAKRDAMSSADLFILPTRSENFGMVVAEALAVGTPVITTRGAPWERLTANECGWWTDVGVEPMAAALRQAMSMPGEQLRAMGDRGTSWMVREFSWDTIGRAMADLYAWLRSPGGPAPSSILSTREATSSA